MGSMLGLTRGRGSGRSCTTARTKAGAPASLHGGELVSTGVEGRKPTGRVPGSLKTTGQRITAKNTKTGFANFMDRLMGTKELALA